MGAISDFIQHHFRHFNAAALVDAADGYVEHLESGGSMLVTLAGAMSTAELGRSHAAMIRPVPRPANPRTAGVPV